MLMQLNEKLVLNISSLKFKDVYLIYFCLFLFYLITQNKSLNQYGGVLQYCSAYKRSKLSL